MVAFCRQRAKMVGESEHFWLKEVALMGHGPVRAQMSGLHTSSTEL
jgi:hypothetical protein